MLQSQLIGKSRCPLTGLGEGGHLQLPVKALPVSPGREWVGAEGPVSTVADCLQSPLGSGWDKKDRRPCKPGEGSPTLSRD